MTNVKFKILLLDKDKKTVDIDYRLNDTELAEKWFSKIRHLHRIPIDTVESHLEKLSDLARLYQEFSIFAGLPVITLPHKIDQPTCNMLHQIYADNHDRLAGRKDSEIMYRFHHAIHQAERVKRKPKHRLMIGWGIKEGPLTETMNCQPFYESSIKRNNLYLPWAELGKTPYTYWRNAEPNDQKRFNELCKPHITFRALFFVALTDIGKPTPFPNQFNQYFNQFKSQWLKEYNVDDWTEREEVCAPLLAYTDTNIDMRDLCFKKIVI